jgi:hypothetical protein
MRRQCRSSDREAKPFRQSSRATCHLDQLADITTMTTIANYNELMHAQLMRTALESSGITAYIPDELTVQSSGNTYALAIGGIRLQVADEDEIAARAVLAAMEPT